MYSYCILIFLTLCVLCFYAKSMISSILFKRKYNIKISISSVEIIGLIFVCIVGIINIGICVWALFNN